MPQKNNGRQAAGWRMKMISKDKVSRINELAKKAKSEEGLTNAEVEEREKLRREYIDAIKGNVKKQLKRVRFIEDMTDEEKEKYLKNRNNQ